MAKNSKLQQAKTAKQDEFYTQLADIEKELVYYKKHFKDKVVYCNCDNPFESNFVQYFLQHFDELGLRKLIATCRVRPYIPDDRAYCFTATEVSGPIEKNVSTLRGDGDFRSPECIELLKEADIVVTNPPFSLFREYMAQLMEYGKQFLIVGSQNAITYKEVFPLLKNNQMWLHAVSSISFRMPAHYTARNSGFRVTEDGSKWQTFGNICWFTNLDIPRRHEKLTLYKHYTPEEYPTYDNYDAINVDRTVEIPCDYFGVMGVPITFLDKYNPNQFEILGITSGRDEFEVCPSKRYINPRQINKDGSVSNGSKANTHATIRLETVPSDIYYTADNADGPLKTLYDRILIRRKDTNQ